MAVAGLGARYQKTRGRRSGETVHRHARCDGPLVQRSDSALHVHQRRSRISQPVDPVHPGAAAPICDVCATPPRPRARPPARALPDAETVADCFTALLEGALFQRQHTAATTPPAPYAPQPNSSSPAYLPKTGTSSFDSHTSTSRLQPVRS